jgi:hypothetical protein
LLKAGLPVSSAKVLPESRDTARRFSDSFLIFRMGALSN